MKNTALTKTTRRTHCMRWEIRAWARPTVGGLEGIEAGMKEEWPTTKTAMI